MKLIECYIENFGKLSERRISFSDGLNVFKEDNGFGKTTLTVFIKAMLYGLDDTKKIKLEENDRKHYMPWQGGRFGGSLTFECNKGRFRIERTFMPKASDDTFALYDCKSGRESDAFGSKLGEELFGIDADGFERTVFLSERRLTVKNDNKTISAKLSDLVGADGDVGELDNAISALEERRKYYQKKGGAGKITDTRRLLSENDAGIRELTRLSESLPEKEERIVALKKEIGVLEAKKREADARRSTLSFEKEYRSRISAKDECEQRLAATMRFFGGKVPDTQSIRRAERAYEDALSLEQALEKGIPERKAEHQRKIDELEAVLPKNAAAKKSGRGSFILTLLGALGAAVSAALFIGKAIDLKLLIPLLLVSLATALVGIALGAVKRKRKNINAKKATPILAELEKEKEALRRLDDEAQKTKESLARQKAEYTEFLSGYETKTDFPFEEIRRAVRDIEYLGERQRELSESTASFAREYGFNERIINTGATVLHPEDEVDLADRIRTARATLTLLEREYTTDTEDLSHLDELLEKKKELSDELALAEERLHIIQLTKEYLSGAKDALTARYLGKTRAAFSSYATSLGYPDSKEFNMDTSFALTRTEGSLTKPEEAYSLGTRELFAIIMRLSLIDSLYEGERPFIILDDPLVHLDDKHIQLAEKLMKKLSDKTQIIYLSCSKSRTF